jgi:hypothetical protein
MPGAGNVSPDEGIPTKYLNKFCLGLFILGPVLHECQDTRFIVVKRAYIKINPFLPLIKLKFLFIIF